MKNHYAATFKCIEIKVFSGNYYLNNKWELGKKSHEIYFH